MKDSHKMKWRAPAWAGLIVPGLILLALLVLLPAPAGAEGDSAGDAKIQAMRSDIEACMQPGDAGKKAREAFAKKYNVPLAQVNEKTADRPPASNGSWNETAATIVCNLELRAVIGYFVWLDRAGKDNCSKLEKHPDTYCITYSMQCDHYAWSKGCLKARCPTCCVW